jgi:anti-anti-sigma factor
LAGGFVWDAREDFVMAEKTPFAAVEHLPQAVVVTIIVPYIMDESEVERLRSTLLFLLDEKPGRTIILDFNDVRSLCSAAIGFLVAFKKRVDDGGGKLKICCIQDKVRTTPKDKFIYEIFKVSKLDKYFDLAPTVSDALKSLTAYRPVSMDDALADA